MPKPQYRLEEWRVETRGQNEVLTGFIGNHPNVYAGDIATTSGIVNKDIANKRVETKNSVYILGESYTHANRRRRDAR